MKKLMSLMAVAGLVSISQSAFSVEQADSPMSKPGMKMDHDMGSMDKGMGGMNKGVEGMNKGMEGMNKGKGGEMDPAKMMEHMKMKQERQLKMHDLSNKILAEADPKKQQELKDQQLELMKAQHMQKMKMHHMMMNKHKM